MIIIQGYPPNYKKIRRRFDLKGLMPVFAYGNFVYNPHNVNMSPGLLVHESTHKVQQAQYVDNSRGLRWLWNKLFVSKVEQWWNRYMIDTEFMVMQELEAYAYQYKAFCETQHDRNKRSKYLGIIATQMSGPLYGNVMTYQQAHVALRQGTQNII